MMTFEKIQLAQRKLRQKALRSDLKKAAAQVKHWEDEVALAGKEVDTAKERLVRFLDRLNATETLWRRLRAADSFIHAHQRRITEAYARKDRAWSMLTRANESVIAMCGLQHENLLRILHWKRELGRYK
jgi:DNA repair ATPase RecN